MNVIQFILVMIVIGGSLSAQTRCYIYDTAGNRKLQDLSCDIACTTYVSNTNDAGPGSLRKAVGCAANGDIVTFASFLSGQQIGITSSMILVDKSISIVQSNIGEVPITNTTPTFNITAANVVLKNLVLKTNCQQVITNSGSLTLENVTINDANTNCNISLIHNTGIINVKGNTKITKI